jgi:hypothetical protein
VTLVSWSHSYFLRRLRPSDASTPILAASLSVRPRILGQELPIFCTQQKTRCPHSHVQVDHCLGEACAAPNFFAKSRRTDTPTGLFFFSQVSPRHQVSNFKKKKNFKLPPSPAPGHITPFQDEVRATRMRTALTPGAAPSTLREPQTPPP